ncbi:hypothetical protein BVRB_5g108000 [Beta vulgaris subsp. vulgaris]|nr:hypothetical protein BVRB_5g108000 [Beta vulgaris subsp. vulgaris]
MCSTAISAPSMLLYSGSLCRRVTRRRCVACFVSNDGDFFSLPCMDSGGSNCCSRCCCGSTTTGGTVLLLLTEFL